MGSVNEARAEQLLAVFPAHGSPPITVAEAKRRAALAHGYKAAKMLLAEGRIVKSGSGYTLAPATPTTVGNGPPAVVTPPPTQTAPQTIRIDPEVWRALQGLAVPLVETPNDVLRRVIGLGSRKEQ